MQQRRTWWTAERVGSFLANVDSLDPSPLPVALVDTLVDIGGRRGEVLGLRWSDLDLDNGTATVVDQIACHPRTRILERRPTRRPRSKSTVELHPQTVAALKRRRVEQAAAQLVKDLYRARPATS